MTHHARTTVNSTNRLPRPVIGWIHRHARKHYWRVASWYDLEDLVQDGLMIGYKCLERYGQPTSKRVKNRTRLVDRVKRVRLDEPTKLDEPHFMKLVQTMFHNHMGELIRKKRAVDDETSKLSDMVTSREEGQALDTVSSPVAGLQEMYMLIAEMPEHLKKAVLLCFTDEGAKSLRRLRSRLNGPDDTMSSRMGQLVGFPVDRDFETELRAYIWERDNVA